MGYGEVFNNMIEEKLLNMHTAYLAKVISTNGTTAKIQPLGNVKAYGQNAKAQSPLSNVPILKQARNEITTGDIVLCVCCERSITDAKKGINSTPVIGHHSMSDSIIVGCL